MKHPKRILILLGSVATLLLIATVVLSILLIRRSTPEEPSVWEAYYNNKCAAYAVENANFAKGQIIFVGDSITDLYVLDDHYADLPLAAYNRGIGGDTTSGVLERLEVSIFDLSPTHVVLMIGTNDVNGGATAEEIAARYAQIVQRIRAGLPEATLYCMSVIPQNAQLETYSTVKVAETTEVILALNREIRRTAEANGAVYLDLFSRLADENDRLIGSYSDDGLHLNVAGLTVWTELIKPYFTAADAP